MAKRISRLWRIARGSRAAGARAIILRPSQAASLDHVPSGASPSERPARRSAPGDSLLAVNPQTRLVFPLGPVLLSISNWEKYLHGIRNSRTLYRNQRHRLR